MHDDRDTKANEIAVFRHGLIADLIHGEEEDGSRTLIARLREKAGRSYCIPHSKRTRIAVETLRDWLHAYRNGGFDALKPQGRKDAGAVKSIASDVADLLITLKEEHADWSVSMVIDEAKRLDEAACAASLPLSTVHRILSRAGVMRGPDDASPAHKDKRHFQYQRANELWMSDVMHGPGVGVGGRRRAKTYLHGILDDATRVVPYSAFALHENTTAFLPVFRQGVQRRGLPDRLYVDNGSVFRSHHLSLVCAKLGVTLIHARPHQPSGKGKVERFFRTVRMRFLPRLTAADFASLDTLNQRYWAWIESDYHGRGHKGLDGISPHDAWAMKSSEVRVPGPEHDLRELFLFETKRKVQRDRTVSLCGVLYEVDAALVGETVTLRYEPSRLGAPVDVWHQGRRVHTAKAVDAYANCFVKRNHSSKSVEADGEVSAPPAGLSMRMLREEGEA